METNKPTVGVVMTLLELYRKTDPKHPAVLGDHWKAVLEEIFADEATLHFTGVSCTAEEVAAAVSSCEKADCDLLAVLPLAYAPSGAAVEALSRTGLPVLLISSARDVTLPYDMGGEHIMANHAMHGVQDLANVLGRGGRQFEFLSGHPSQVDFRDALVRMGRAASGATVLLRGKVGRIGKPFEGMLDFDPGQAFEDVFDMTVSQIDPTELGRSAEKVTKERIREIANWARDNFEIAPDLKPDVLDTSVRWSLALEDIVEVGRLDAVTMNFLDVAAAGARTMPFLGASRLMSRGVGYAGEGDVLTATLMTAVARIAGEATFTEMFCPDYERNEILLSHMGECNFAMADPVRPVRLIAKPFAFGDCVSPAVPVFQLRPGMVTLVSITQWPDEGFRLVVSSAEVLAAPEHPNLQSPYTRIAFGRALPDFLEDYSRAGGTHHLALAYGDLIGDLSALARFSNIGFEIVQE